MYKSGSYKKALEHSNIVYERNPLRTDNLLLLGAIYYQVCYFCFFYLFCLLFVWLHLYNAQYWFIVEICGTTCLAQLHDFDMCVAKNEEALRIEPHFAECYGNMANAWKVSHHF
jgi:protein O-GlcNAc transferase